MREKNIIREIEKNEREEKREREKKEWIRIFVKLNYTII